MQGWSPASRGRPFYGLSAFAHSPPISHLDRLNTSATITMHRIPLFIRLMMPVMFILMITSLERGTAQPVSVLKGLKEGQSVQGFRAVALYLNDVGDALGARFVHENTGFTLDLVRLQSVPQSFIWVNSWPTSDMGEPHT